MKRRSFTVDRPGPLAPQLALALSCSQGEALALVRRGATYVDGRRARGDAVVVAAGARVLVVLEEAGRAALEASAGAAPLAVVYEDGQVLAVDKPAGVTAQPTPGRVGDSLLDLASAYLGRPAGLVHRLDRETSGLTVFGKSREATSRLAREFREGRAVKQYLAAAAPGLPPEGVIALPLSRDPSRPGRWRASAQANGLSAETRFRRLFEGPVCGVALFPRTGRTHQLRAHLAALGHSIVGDALYGGLPGPRCLLHARRLQVLGLELAAPLPEDFVALRQAADWE
jgi:23S rRNA pseudouridine1911/1915/1917 synthase